MTHYAQDHLRDMVRKQFEAHDKFAAMLIAIAGISQDQANNMVNWYQRKKLVTFDPTNARLVVKHGSYLDKEFIEHYAAHGAF